MNDNIKYFKHILPTHTRRSSSTGTTTYFLDNAPLLRQFTGIPLSTPPLHTHLVCLKTPIRQQPHNICTIYKPQPTTATFTTCMKNTIAPYTRPNHSSRRADSNHVPYIHPSIHPSIHAYTLTIIIITYPLFCCRAPNHILHYC